MDDDLTERDRQILAFERSWWRFAGAKEEAIRQTFGISVTRYYQIVNDLIERPAALRAEPQVVHRLLRKRDGRRYATRSA